MFNQLIKFAFVSSVVLVLRQRWKRLCGCAAAILLAIYAHAEFLDYVAALPPGTPEAAGNGNYLLAAFVLKNTVIGLAILLAVLLELRASRRASHRADRTKALGSRVRKKRAQKIEAHMPDDGPHADDGFDFLRRRGKLATRGEQIMQNKPRR